MYRFQNSITKTIQLTLLVIFMVCGCKPNAANSNKKLKPNVVLVITDDQGYGDMSCHGHPFLKTPELDDLAEESIRFTNFHADPTCAPTRSALLTGKYSSKVGVWHTLQGRSIMYRDEITLAEVFADNGYKTGLFGKWHLGDNYPYRPEDRGFQETVYFQGGGIAQNPGYWRNDYFDDVYLHNGKRKLFEGYCTDVWFNEAMKFVEKNKDNPFFCYISTNAPHFWYFIAEKYAHRFREMGMGDFLSRYYGMIENIDENMGKLFKKLDELSLTDNTIFVFMTDNGKSPTFLPKDGPFYYNAHMRGEKGSIYEGGHRVPLFIRWPAGKITGGKDVQELAAHFDLMPTLIDLCELENNYNIDFDGKSLTSLLGKNNDSWNERTLFVHNQRVETPVKWRNCAVMTQKYRLINGKELYDMEIDPSQRTDIAEANPEIVKKLRTEYDIWWESLQPAFNQNARIPIGDEHENPTLLNCHDWHNEEPLYVWNQDTIRARKHKNGFWTIDVVQDGEYEFTCRTYPKQEDTRMNVSKVRLKIGDNEIEKNCYTGSSEVKLKTHLKKGETTAESWFYEKDGNNFGVPFIYVERL
jgi:arylsulfatase A-like enzyme